MEIECHPFSRLIIVGPPLIMQSLPSTFHFPPSRRLEHSAKPRGIALRRCNQNVRDKAAIPWAARSPVNHELYPPLYCASRTISSYGSHVCEWRQHPRDTLCFSHFTHSFFHNVRLTVTMSDFLLRFHYYIIMCLTLTCMSR